MQYVWDNTRKLAHYNTNEWGFEIKPPRHWSARVYSTLEVDMMNKQKLYAQIEYETKFNFGQNNYNDFMFKR